MGWERQHSDTYELLFLCFSLSYCLPGAAWVHETPVFFVVDEWL